MIKISLGQGVLASALVMGLASSSLFADGSMTPPSPPTPKSNQQVQKVRNQKQQQTQSSQQSQEDIEQQQLDRQQYQQSQPVRRDIPEPDDLFDD